MTEVRRVLWPDYEAPQWADPLRFQQGIAGSLELFFWAWVKFQRVVDEVTGHVVPMFQRVDQAGFTLPLDERVLADTDTLFVFGLDHMVTEQVRRSRGDRGRSRVPQARGDLPRHRPAPRRRALAGHEGARHGVPPPRRRAGAAPATLRRVHAFADEGTRDPRRESVGPSPRGHHRWTAPRPPRAWKSRSGPPRRPVESLR